jgi:signal transduction histidine kinase
LGKRLPEDPQCHRLLHIAVQGGQRGASLTKRLLAFSRRQELTPASVDIGELVSGMEELLTRALGVGVELNCQLPSTLPPVMVDANQLELALLNLALNARDAMPGGGKLTISASEQTIAAVAESSLPPGSYLRITIVDTGMGMDAATRGRAIEPFFTTKRTGMETGLGLSVVHGIAAQSGGLLRIESAPNAGTTVELWLPRSKLRPVSVARNVGTITASNGVNVQ